MGHALEEIESEILQLPEPARARLAKSLLLSLGENDDTDVEELWAEEAEARYREIESGEVTPIPSDDVLREARSRLK
jgi:putative addiction module component (TIGR02574 family)